LNFNGLLDFISQKIELFLSKDIGADGAGLCNCNYVVDGANGVELCNCNDGGG
jgi:hypothetical protein